MTRILKAFVALFAIMLVAGCGGGSSGGSSNGIDKLTADKAFAKVKADSRTVTAVHAKGTISQQGNTLTLDVQAGKGKGQGTISVGGGTLEMRLLNGTAYLKGDEAVMRSFGASDAEVAATAGKWLKSPASGGPFESFNQFLDVDQLFGSSLTPSGTLKTGTTTELDGKKVYTLIDDGSDGGTLYVQLEGKALPLRLAKAGTDGGHIDFYDYDKDFTVTAPEGAVDLSTLGG